jgi:alkylresorcinol/alkylpyrone synthase
MPQIASVGTCDPPYELTQLQAASFARDQFRKGFEDIDRLLKMFDNTLIVCRRFAMPLEWYTINHTLQERNDAYIARAVEFGEQAIYACLQETDSLVNSVAPDEIDAIFFISTTGLATPSIEARIMNRMPFSRHTKRIPIWGLGCAGGVAGIARASEYCRAYPQAKVIVLALELCSLTFQPNDFSKSNLVGTSLFADGAACALVVGDSVREMSRRSPAPHIRGCQSTLMPNSERVMGWDVKEGGLHVVFSRDIPDIIRHWLRDNVIEFLTQGQLTLQDVKHFVAHPGGRKILEAYEEALNIGVAMTEIPRRILRDHGNMSSPSVLYVLRETLKEQINSGDVGLMAALGPGFTSELLLLEWE